MDGLSASEQDIERLREHNRMISRLAEVEWYMDGAGNTRTFTKYAVQKMLQHVRLGGGWI
jgi:hypothetical protein